MLRQARSTADLKKKKKKKTTPIHTDPPILEVRLFYVLRASVLLKLTAEDKPQDHGKSHVTIFNARIHYSTTLPRNGSRATRPRIGMDKNIL